MDTPSTIRVTARPLRTAGLAAVLLAAFAGAAEWAARTEAVRRRLGAPGTGSANASFDVALDRLEAAARRGPLDCLVLGSSVAYWGVDPRRMADAYRARTGAGLRCVTFGVNGLTAATAASLAPVLARRCRPRLLLFVTTPRLVPLAMGRDATRALEASPWLASQRGEFTLAGWLANRSAAYRLYLAHQGWMRESYWKERTAAHLFDTMTAPDGHGRDIGHPAGRPPVGVRRSRTCPDAWDYPVNPAPARGLEPLAALAAAMPVAIVRMPVPLGALRRCPARKAEVRRAAHALARWARGAGIPVWAPDPPWLGPDADYYDFVHLNAAGAARLSAWLGERLAARALGSNAPGEAALAAGAAASAAR